MIDETQPITLSKDTFLSVLGLRDLEARLRGPHEREFLFKLAIEYVNDTSQTFELADSSHPGNELAIKIPGTAYVAQLTRTSKEELATIIGLGYFVFGVGHVDPTSVTVAMLMMLASKIRRLRAQYGERSIVDALAQTPRPTTRNVASILHGKACRYPDADCRFRADDGLHCAISLEQIELTMSDLETRGFLRKLYAGNPPEYGIII